MTCLVTNALIQQWITHKYTNCSCEEDCQGVSYKIFPSETPLDVTELCKKELFVEIIEEQRYNMFPKFIEEYEYWAFDEPRRTDQDFCHYFFKNYVTFLSIETPTSSITKSERDIRVSFGDQLAMIGGTLGLFSGMSFLSMVEIICWLGRLSLIHI